MNPRSSAVRENGATPALLNLQLYYNTKEVACANLIVDCRIDVRVIYIEGAYWLWLFIQDVKQPKIDIDTVIELVSDVQIDVRNRVDFGQRK